MSRKGSRVNVFRREIGVGGFVPVSTAVSPPIIQGIHGTMLSALVAGKNLPAIAITFLRSNFISTTIVTNF